MNIYSLIEGNLEQGQGMCLWLLNFHWQLGQLAPTCKFLLAGLGCGMLGIGADGNRPGRKVGGGVPGSCERGQAEGPRLHVYQTS